MTEVEQLIVAQALYKIVAGQVATKDPDNLRGQVDIHYRDMYETMRSAGAAPKSFDLTLDNEKVGTYSITVSKPKPSESEENFIVNDITELRKWDGGDLTMQFLAEHLVDYARWYFDHTGELPPGCDIETVITPEIIGGEIERTTLKVDEKRVVEIMGARLPEVTTMLLEGGNGTN